MEMVLPMNTGAEAVETAIKTARKWGYEVKGVPDGQAVIVAFEGNFHGRTTTIVSFSTDPDARASYGPVHARVPRRPLRRRRRAGRGHGRQCGRRAGRADPGRGRVSSCRRPASWPGCAELCSAHGALMIADEIQSGLGRTGHHVRLRARAAWSRTCTCWARRSAAASCRSPRWCPPARCSACSSPASTAPRSAATRWPARSAARSSRMLATGEYQERSAKLGAHMHDRLAALPAGGGPRGPRPGPVGRRWSSPRCPAGPGVRAARRARRAGQGHPRHHDPAGPAAGDQRGGPGLGPGPGRGRRD